MAENVILHEQTLLAADPFGSLGKPKGPFLPDAQPECMFLVRPEQGHLVPRGIIVRIVFQHATVIVPTLAGNSGQPFPGDTDQLGRIMRGVVHRPYRLPTTTPDVDSP